MCLPVMAVLAIASTVVSFVAAKQQADSAKSSAEQSYAVAQQTYAVQQKQIDAQATDQMSDRAREAEIERGRMRVVAAESGISGNSTDQLTHQSFFDEGFDVSRIEEGRLNAQKQAYQNAAAGVAQSQNQINSIKQPSLIGTGLQIASDYYDPKLNPDMNKPITTTTTKVPNVK